METETKHESPPARLSAKEKRKAMGNLIVLAQMQAKAAREELAIEDPLVRADLRAVVELAKAFPSLWDIAGLGPWDPVLFRASAMAKGDDQVACSALFLLSIWCGEDAFDMHFALSIWDEAHRAAFTAWAAKPWWP